MSTPTRYTIDSIDHYITPSTFNMSIEMKKRLVPGAVVICNKMCPVLAEEEGIVIDAPELLDGHDCVVKLDNFDKPFGFYWNELYII